MTKECKEVLVPVPYGHIATKVWGNRENSEITIIAIHGWMDNASTFDPLIENLEGCYHIIAIDLPGHGLSSHYPPGVPYRNISWIIDIRRLFDYFNLDRVTFLGHSLGGNLCLMFASVYPDKIERVITCDIFKEATFQPDKIAEEMASSIEQFLECEKRPRVVRPFSYDECVDILISTHFNGNLNRRMAETLLRRAAKETPEGFVFTRDPRLTTMIHQKFDVASMAKLYSNSRCEKFFIIGNRGTTNMESPDAQTILDVHSKSNNFRKIKVSGDHYFHLCSPIDTARHIDSYLKSSLENKKSQKDLTEKLEKL